MRWIRLLAGVLGAGVLGAAALLTAPAGAVSTGAAPSTQAADQGGQVYAWGRNWSWELGTGTTSEPEVPAPQQVTGLPDDITAIAAGVTHNLALGSGGRVYAWGRNEDGQVGTGTTSHAAVPAPQQVTGLPDDITAIAAGYFHSLALGQSGRVYAWGGNWAGQVGTNTNREPVPAPRQVTGLPDDITAIAAGGSHSLALGSDGRVYAWGGNHLGQLGTGTTRDELAPQQVTGLPADITAIAAGGSHSLALGSDGQVYAWGQNSFGQLGTGTISEPVLAPKRVTGLPDDVTAIAAGGYHSLALGSDGRVYAWGANYSGQLGTGTTSDVGVPAPQRVTGLPDDITAIAASEFHSLAVARVAQATPAPTSTTLTATAAEQQHGEPVTLTAQVTCTGHSPDGRVEFLADGTSMGTADLAGGTAELTVSDLNEGTHHITAVYTGSTGCAPSTSEPVTVTITPAAPPPPQQSSTTLTVTPAVQELELGGRITLTAHVTCPAGTATGTVGFFSDGISVSSVGLVRGTAVQPVIAVDEGTYAITAVYTGSTGCAPSTSEPVTVTITPAAPPPPQQSSTTLTVTPAVQELELGGRITLTAHVTCPAGTATGTVGFFSDGISVSSVGLVRGTAVQPVIAVDEGTYAITAVYTGSTGCAPSTSEPVTVTITPAAPPPPARSVEFFADGTGRAPFPSLPAPGRP